MKKAGVVLATCVLALVGCGDPGGPYDDCSRCGPGTVCEYGRCVADNGNGGGGDGYQDPCAYVNCREWETCSAGICNFDTTSQWNVIAASGTVADHDPNGEAWDALGGAPDPYACMTVNGQKSCTSTKQDTFHPVWNERLFSRAGAGSLMGGIAVSYVDEDVSSNDVICSGTVTVSKQNFNNGALTVNCVDENGTPAGSSVTFALEFVP